MSVNIGTKSSRCSLMRLVGTGSKTQLLVADFLTIHSTSLPDNMMNLVNLCSVSGSDYEFINSQFINWMWSHRDQACLNL